MRPLYLLFQAATPPIAASGDTLRDCYVSAWYSYYYGSGQAAAADATFDAQRAGDYLSYAWLDLWSCESGY